MSNQEYKVSDSMFQEVAEEAFTAVNECWREVVEAHEEAVGLLTEEEIEHELYLYVSVDGDWAIDHAQYFSRFHIFTAASVYQYQNVDALQYELEANADWDMVRVEVNV